MNGIGERLLGRNFNFYRLGEVAALMGDAHELGWNPNTNFENLVSMMMDADMSQA
jgi:GDP-D-mannose dehydratase